MNEKSVLQVIVFAGGSNWPIWIAQSQGYFAANGIAVKLRRALSIAEPKE